MEKMGNRKEKIDGIDVYAINIPGRIKQYYKRLVHLV